MTKTITRRQFLQLSACSLLGASMSGCEWAGIPERLERSNLSNPLPDAPNVLFIVLDTVRARNLSLYGYERPTTPNLESIARRGVKFNRAIAPAPWTLPSHATMFTGRWPYEHLADFYTPLNDHYPTIAEVFKSLGYSTAGFVANMGYCSYESGLQRGFTHYEDYPVTPETIFLSSSVFRRLAESKEFRALSGYHELVGRKNAAEVSNSFLRWLPQARGRPFFAFLNYFDAHKPYLPPSPFDQRFGPKLKRGDDRIPRSDWSDEEVQAEIDAYDGAIAYLDDEIGNIFDQLEHKRLIENTIVIITSDHGEQFGGHNLFDHTNSLYIQTLRVPLILSFPSNLPMNISVPQAVSLRDLPQTIMDLLNIETNVEFPGDSLTRFWKDDHQLGFQQSYMLSELSQPDVMEDWYPIAKGNMKSLVRDPYHYIQLGDGSEELYDLDQDPTEATNLAHKFDTTLTSELRSELHALLNPV